MGLIIVNPMSGVPGSKATNQQRRDFKESLFAVWFSALNISEEDIKFSIKEIIALTEYFYICELMVRCKESAVRVSPDVWAGIESRSLTVPAE